MAFNQKPSETGWFYHAPAKPQQAAEPQAVPPPSQIPGLGGNNQQPEEPQRRMYIKDTDSNYIKMAKMGGRADLLRFRSPKPRNSKPVGYPRVDWFYQDDVTADRDEADNDQYEFMLPDYMVHQTIQDIKAKKVTRGEGDRKGAQQKRAPYAHDKTTVFEREGASATNKQVKLPELRQPGYGVRNEKSQGKPVKPIPHGEKAKMCKPAESELANQHRRAHMPAPSEADQYSMGKIMSHGYGKEWEQHRNEWEDTQDQRVGQDTQPMPKERVQTEYQANSQHNAAKRGSGKSGSRKESAGELEGKKIQARKEREENERPEMFKLSKFKNVPARTETHRHANKPAGAN